MVNYKRKETVIYRASFPLLTGVTLYILLFLLGCSGKHLAPVKEMELDALTCIIVTPTATPVNLNENISYQQAQTLEKGAAIIDTIIMEKLGGSKQFRFATQKQMDAALSENKQLRMDQLRTVSNTLSCNSVLTTDVNRFRERIGSVLAVDSAASATIQMKLISVANGRVLWEDVFQETQQPLFGNLFSLSKASRRGFKWVTVRELASSGLEELLIKCPYIAVD